MRRSVLEERAREIDIVEGVWYLPVGVRVGVGLHSVCAVIGHLLAQVLSRNENKVRLRTTGGSLIITWRSPTINQAHMGETRRSRMDDSTFTAGHFTDRGSRLDATSLTRRCMHYK